MVAYFNPYIFQIRLNINLISHTNMKAELGAILYTWLSKRLLIQKYQFFF